MSLFQLFINSAMTCTSDLCPVTCDLYSVHLALGSTVHQAPVVQTLDSAIHRINHYPVDSVIDFPNTYPLDSDLSVG